MTTKFLCLSTVVLLLAAPRSPAAIPAAENLLPADTLAFFAVPDCAAARMAAKSSPAWMFWGDPAMRPFTDKLAAKWNEQFVEPLEHDLGIRVGNFTDLPQGQFTIAVTLNGLKSTHDDTPPGLLLLLDAKGRSDLLKTNLAVLMKKWTAAGRALRTEEIHGLAFTVVPLASNDFAGMMPKKAPVSELGAEPAKPEKPGEIYFTQFESLLVAGNSAKVVEPVAAHLTGGSVPALAEQAGFAADKLAQFREGPQYYGWFNGKTFLDLLSSQPTDGEEESSPFPGLSMNKILVSAGLSGIKSISFALREAPDGTTLKVHLTAPEAERTGLTKILALPPKDASVPQFVPADAVKFSRIRLDGKQTWAEIQKMVAGISPSGETGLNALINMANSLGQQKTPGFDIRNDLFGNLTDDIISYQKPSGDSPGELPEIFLIGVVNADTMINAVKMLTGIGNPQDSESKPREFLGHKIYSLGLKPARTAGGGQPQALYVSSSGGYLAVSKDISILEEFLRNADGQNKALRDSPGLANAVQHLGGTGGGLFGYENQRETMRSAFKVARSSFTAEATAKAFPATRDWLDFSLLPDFDTVAKYFYLSAFAGSANADGLTFTAFTPRPPQLK
jgi:hypothetical protein